MSSFLFSSYLLHFNCKFVRENHEASHTQRHYLHHVDRPNIWGALCRNRRHLRPALPRDRSLCQRGLIWPLDHGRTTSNCHSPAPGDGRDWEVLAAVAGSELGFLTLHYKNWGWPALISSAFWVTVVSFAYEIFKQGYIHLALPMILALFCTWLVSDLLFGAVLVHYVVRLLVRAHAIQPA